jgi:hypothetical protein
MTLTKLKKELRKTDRKLWKLVMKLKQTSIIKASQAKMMS